jgi:hypothetical protein
MKMIQESLNHLNNKVDENRENQHQEMALLETRCTQRITASSLEQQTKIQDISKTLLQQIQHDQTSNQILLRSILEERDSSMEQKMNENFQAILSKLNCNSISPTRKKSNQTPTTQQPEGDEIMHDSTVKDCHDRMSNVINPYHKNSQQRRNVTITLPTTSP